MAYQLGTWDAFPSAESSGLDAREYFAGLAMQGLVARHGECLSPQQIALQAVVIAETLLNELSKTRSQRQED